MIFYIIVAVIGIILLVLESNAIYVTNLFKHANVLVFGKKRRGKDLIFQKVINKRKKPYFANIPYGKKYHHIDLTEISVQPNTYEDLINGTVKKIPFNSKREKIDIYISDGGVHLPSQYNHILNKQYPSMPLYYSLSGHLYDSNVHVNYNGSTGRLWDKLREQADEYIRALKTVIIGPLFFTKLRYFETFESAEKNVLPMKRSLFNPTLNGLKAQFDATNGVIRDMWILQLRSSIKYDTRYFKGVFFELPLTLH
jgi:hypothetical protein